MRVLFVVDSFAEGGAGRVVARLTQVFEKKGNAVAVLPVFDNTIIYPVAQNAKVYKTFDNPLAESVLKRSKLIRDCAKDFKADTVIAFLTYINIYAVIAGFGQKWKTFISERNNPYVDPQNQKLRTIRKFVYPFANGLICQTPDAKEYFSRFIQRKSAVIPNPVSEEIPNPYTGKRTKRIVSAGRLTKQKNYYLAIDAFAKIADKYPEFTYEIYGQGEEHDRLTDYIQKSGLNGRVLLKGQSSHLMEDINNASVFLMSSDYEGMSNSLIEALAMGIPVISTDHPIGGAKMLITDQLNGLLVPVNNVDKMAEALDKVLGNPAFAQSLSSNASAIKDALNIDAIGEQWIQFVKR